MCSEGVCHSMHTCVKIHSVYAHSVNFTVITVIPVRFCVIHRELCVVFCKTCFMKLKTESKADN